MDASKSGKGLDVRDQALWGNQNDKALNSIVNISQKNPTITNIDYLEIINAIRIEHSEPKIRLNDLNLRIVDELEGDYYETFVVTNPNKTTSVGIHLTLDQCTLIGMRETKGVRRSVMRYIKELQEKISRPVMDLNNPEFLRDLLLNYSEQNIQLQQRVAVLEPKAQVMDQIADTQDSYCLRSAAKIIGTRQNQLIGFMQMKGWIFRAASNELEAYSNRIQQGVMAEKVTVVKTARGDRTVKQARITAKGLTRLTALCIEAGLAQGVAA